MPAAIPLTSLHSDCLKKTKSDGSAVSPRGVYAFPSRNGLLSSRPAPRLRLAGYGWDVCVFVRQGVYQGAVLRACIVVPEHFPTTADSPVRRRRMLESLTAVQTVIFLGPVFHPQIDPASGRCNISSQFPSWE